MMGDMSLMLGSKLAGALFVFKLFQKWFPQAFDHIKIYLLKLLKHVYPYITVIFHEYQMDTFGQSLAYTAIERYLSNHSSHRANRYKGDILRGCKSVFLKIDDYEEVTDEFEGTKVWWSSADGEDRYFKLTFHRKHRDIITKHYLKHVIDEGKDIALNTRPRKLYTNNNKNNWTYILFEHPSTFDTLAMDPKKKNDILKDLIKFRKSEEYYKKTGKSWKRGYLLYGPPGTGKSSMIAAMANLLEYDIYDLELTTVNANTDLRNLLAHTSSKSIIVIEDIDCSLDLTGQRKKEKEDAEKLGTVKNNENDKKKKGREVTLSGLLNFIDGLWSACGSERLIVFTTNHVEKLDPALVRRGRMDMHIEMSYCCFESFKVLAKNYLDLESHELFATISRLLNETSMTPADVAENLMPKSDEDNAESCLNNLIKCLENLKEEAGLEAVEESSDGDEAGKKSEKNNEKLQDGDESSDEGSSDEESSDEESSDVEPTDEED